MILNINSLKSVIMKTNFFKSKSKVDKNLDYFISKTENSKLSKEELNYIKGGDGDGTDKDPIKL